MVSGRRRDDRPIGRRGPRRAPKYRILVVCEGRVTEPQYIKAFQHDVRNTRVHVEVAEKTGVPLTAVHIASRLKKEAADRADREGDDNLRFDIAWAVFDVDAHPNLLQALTLATEQDVQVALSNPCFELWALLHFEDQRSHIERDAVASALRRHLPGYEKALPYSKLKSQYKEAVQRALSLAAEASRHADPRRNPTTGGP